MTRLYVEKTVLSIFQPVSVRNVNSCNSDCINLCDVGENFINKRKPRDNWLPEKEC